MLYKSSPVIHSQAMSAVSPHYKNQNISQGFYEHHVHQHSLGYTPLLVLLFSRGVLPKHLPESSTTHQEDAQLRRFRIIHPYHPLYQQEFDLVDYVHDWREHRVYFYDQENNLKSIPTSWTSFLPMDPFVLISSGRSHFRTNELLKLAALVQDIKTRKNV